MNWKFQLHLGRNCFKKHGANVNAVHINSLVRCLQSLVSYQLIHGLLNHKLFVQCRENYFFNERVVHKFLVEKKTEKTLSWGGCLKWRLKVCSLNMQWTFLWLKLLWTFSLETHNLRITFQKSPECYKKTCKNRACSVSIRTLYWFPKLKVYCATCPKNISPFSSTKRICRCC